MLRTAAAVQQNSSALLASKQQTYNPAYAVSRPTFVCFGDSITEFGYNGPSGWVSLLSQYYSRKVGTLLSGVSAES